MKFQPLRRPLISSPLASNPVVCKRYLYRLGLFFSFFGFAIFGFAIWDTANIKADILATANTNTGANAELSEKQANVIVIQGLTQIRPSGQTLEREMPAVVFQHNSHVTAVKAAGKDCDACHINVTNPDGTSAYSFSFITVAESGAESGKALQDLYHAKCLSCHQDISKTGLPSGPQIAECRACHSDSPANTASSTARKTITLDKVAHYRHINSSQITVAGSSKNCAACHHVYNAATKSLQWVENQEDSCRACHFTAAEQQASLAKNPDTSDANGRLADRPRLDVAVHTACVNCHLQISSTKPDAKNGPTDCFNCHSAEAQQHLADEYAKAAATTPRLQRGQKDAYLMLPPIDMGTKSSFVGGMMPPVSFNHAFHEGVVADCRSCHHQRIDSCAVCHTIPGAELGAYTSLTAAMHSSSDPRSCIGCHNQQKVRPVCAGCHVSMPVKFTDYKCETCHTPTADQGYFENLQDSLLVLRQSADTEALAQRAQAEVADRLSRNYTTFNYNDIPEKVSLGVIANEFQPAELPHRKIVDTLLQGLANNRLGQAFHQEEAAICQGCHHNSPPSLTPPACASCHSAMQGSISSGVMQLKAAYHQRCMSCHERMEQKPYSTACNDCHKPISAK